MVEFGTGTNWFWQDWTGLQWGAGVGALLLAVLAGVIIYAVIFGVPGGIFFVPEGEEVMHFWRGVMDRRAEVRGRITRKMVAYMGFAVGLLIVAGGAVWFAW
jgi:hypothetical protein